MAGRDVQGIAEAYAFLGAIPDAATEEFGEELTHIGYDLLGAQKRDVAKATGALSASLAILVQLDQLRVRVGLLSRQLEARKFNGRTRKARAGGPFYGPFVEYGRSAQTVLVTRRVKNRRVRGNGRTSARRVIYQGATKRRRRSSSPNAGTFVGDPYKLRVRAMAARPYVHKDRPELRPEQRIAAFWARTLTTAGAAG